MVSALSHPARGRPLLVVGLVGSFLVVLARTAWVCDDAFVTVRVAQNLLDGHGLRWNVAERVQAFTHPLWLGLLIPVLAIAPPAGGLMALGAALSTGLVTWLGARARGAGLALVAVAVLGSSAFVDFSTSGLENPLSNLLVLATFAASERWARSERWSERALVVLAGAAAATTRLDHALLVGPLVARVVADRSAARALPALVVGSAPLLAWEAFSLVYYGFLVPNTAWAKLATEVPVADALGQGLAWLASSAGQDPVTSAVVVLGAASGARGRGVSDRAASLGLVGFVGWVVWVGGDHMAGRFLTAPFVLALAVLGRSRWAVAPTLLLLALAAAATNPPMLSGADVIRRPPDAAGVVDERAFYYQTSGWRSPTRRDLTAQGAAVGAGGPRTVVWSMIGWFGVGAGPDVHLVDPLGLSDPLLARLPPRLGPHRVGHWRRDLPAGYVDAAASGAPLADPDLGPLWQDVLLVTRGPLFTRERWAAMWRLNLHPVDDRARGWCRRECSVLPLAELALPTERVLAEHGVATDLGGQRVRRVSLDVDPGRYTIEVTSDGAPVVTRDLRAHGGPVTVDLGPARGDRLRVLPERPGSHLRWLRLGHETPPRTRATRDP